MHPAVGLQRVVELDALGAAAPVDERDDDAAQVGLLVEHVTAQPRVQRARGVSVKRRSCWVKTMRAVGP